MEGFVVLGMYLEKNNIFSKCNMCVCVYTARNHLIQQRNEYGI